MSAERWMQRALELAEANTLGGPFGALVVFEGSLVAEGANLVTSSNDPTAHAEVVAIRRACAVLGSFQLTGCELYTSCEPCPMCLGAICWARPASVFYSATHEDAAMAGFDDSFIYRQTRMDVEQRAIPMRQLLGEAGRRPFENWLRKTDRIPY